MKKDNTTKTVKMAKTGYTSKIDQLFHDFDAHRKSFPESRHAEKKKYEIIAAKRDKA